MVPEQQRDYASFLTDCARIFKIGFGIADLLTPNAEEEMKKSTCIIIALALLLQFSVLIAQPEMSWIHTFSGGSQEGYWDIYAVSDSGYIMCGTSSMAWNIAGALFITRIDNEGNEIWSNVYGNQDDYASARTIVELDNGDFLVGGRSTGQGAVGYYMAMRISADGDVIWRRDYRWGECRAVIELKCGDFLMAGETERHGHVMMINGDGDVLWERSYQIGGEDIFSRFTGMRETDGGVVVSGEGIAEERQPMYAWFVKIDIENEGAVIWERSHNPVVLACNNALDSCPGGGFAIVGNTVELGVYILKIDDNGELLWSRTFNKQSARESGNCLIALDDGGFSIVGYMIGNTVDPFIIRADNNGGQIRRSNLMFQNERDIHHQRPNSLNSVVVGADNSVTAAGLADTGEGGHDGLVVKYEGEINGPMILNWTPEDLTQMTLSNGIIRFEVEARNQWGQEMNYLWILDEDTLGHADRQFIRFRDYGRFNLRCEVSYQGITIPIEWEINVSEFYIDEATPDTSSITVQRNTLVDFTLDIVAEDGVDVDYLWTMVGRRNEMDFEDQGTLSYPFNLTGNFELEGLVWNENHAESRTWSIHVNSPVWSWYPDALVLSVFLNTTRSFGIFPSNVESDSLSHIWKVDDETIEVDDAEESIEINFPETGDHTVTGILLDGCDGDTITWNITVFGPNRSINNEMQFIPQVLRLEEPSPNPFNSTTRLTFSLPATMPIILNVYDCFGREIAKLMDETLNSGEYTIAFVADDIPAGLYFVSLATDDGVKIQKLTLIK